MIIRKSVYEKINECESELELKKIECILLYTIQQNLEDLASKKLIYK